MLTVGKGRHRVRSRVIIFRFSLQMQIRAVFKSLDDIYKMGMVSAFNFSTFPRPWKVPGGQPWRGLRRFGPGGGLRLPSSAILGYSGHPGNPANPGGSPPIMQRERVS